MSRGNRLNRPRTITGTRYAKTKPFSLDGPLTTGGLTTAIRHDSQVAVPLFFANGTRESTDSVAPWNGSVFHLQPPDLARPTTTDEFTGKTNESFHRPAKSWHQFKHAGRESEDMPYTMGLAIG